MVSWLAQALWADWWCFFMRSQLTLTAVIAHKVDISAKAIANHCDLSHLWERSHLSLLWGSDNYEMGCLSPLIWRRKRVSVLDSSDADVSLQATAAYRTCCSADNLHWTMVRNFLLWDQSESPAVLRKGKTCRQIAGVQYDVTSFSARRPSKTFYRI